MERRTRRRTIEAVFATGTRPTDYSWYRWMMLKRASADELVLEDTPDDGGPVNVCPSTLSRFPRKA
jgi:hypothetical protein